MREVDDTDGKLKESKDIDGSEQRALIIAASGSGVFVGTYCGKYESGVENREGHDGGDGVERDVSVGDGAELDGLDKSVCFVQVLLSMLSSKSSSLRPSESGGTEAASLPFSYSFREVFEDPRKCLCSFFSWRMRADGSLNRALQPSARQECGFCFRLKRESTNLV